MSSVNCPVDLDTKKLHTAVHDMYSRVATEPDGDFHFHRGSEHAVRTFTSKEKTARHFGVQGVNVAAVKPA